MEHRLGIINRTLRRYGIYSLLHIIILLMSVFLIVCISIDTFKNLAFYRQPEFMRVQFWICIFFLFDFFVEFILSPRKAHYVATHWVFLLVSIPWLAVINYFGWHFHPQVEYAIQFIPLVRGGYALAIVVGWFTSNRATSLFWSYIITLFATVYFASLAFYLFEHDVNKLVNDYSSAIWWAAMDVTTVGSNIIAVTPVGRVLSVLLAALGMMMFPIFTVYVTNKMKRYNRHPYKDIFNISTRIRRQNDETTQAEDDDMTADAEETEVKAQAEVNPHKDN